MRLIGLGGEARIFEHVIVPDPFGSVVIPRLHELQYNLSRDFITWNA